MGIACDKLQNVHHQIAVEEIDGQPRKEHSAGTSSSQEEDTLCLGSHKSIQLAQDTEYRQVSRAGKQSASISRIPPFAKHQHKSFLPEVQVQDLDITDGSEARIKNLWQVDGGISDKELPLHVPTVLPQVDAQAPNKHHMDQRSTFEMGEHPTVLMFEGHERKRPVSCDLHHSQLPDFPNMRPASSLVNENKKRKQAMDKEGNTVVPKARPAWSPEETQEGTSGTKSPRHSAKVSPETNTQYQKPREQNTQTAWHQQSQLSALHKDVVNVIQESPEQELNHPEEEVKVPKNHKKKKKKRTGKKKDNLPAKLIKQEQKSATERVHVPESMEIRQEDDQIQPSEETVSAETKQIQSEPVKSEVNNRMQVATLASTSLLSSASDWPSRYTAVPLQYTEESSRRKEEEEILNAIIVESTAKGERIQQLERQLRRVEKERDDLTLRLSKTASAALTEGNPQICDLSDMNRPTKIGERFSEVYDNQWTNAYEELHERQQMKEEEAIAGLLKSVEGIYAVCKRVATNQMDRLQKMLQEFTSSKKILSERALMKELKQERRVNFKSQLKVLEQQIKEVTHNIFPCEDKHPAVLEVYFSYVLELCWLMCIQDPMVSLYVPKPGEELRKTHMTPYTSNGKYIDYCVWPALLLFEGGQVLSKGAAQGTNAEQILQHHKGDLRKEKQRSEQLQTG